MSAAPKVVRKIGNLFSPSIKDALEGNTPDKKNETDTSAPVAYAYEEYIEPFTQEQFTAKWNEYLVSIADRPNLRATLSSVPEMAGETRFILKIGNSVQEEEIRQVKPELVSWLRRELRNSKIELITKLEKIESDKVYFNDSEKLQMLIQKNPALNELRQKFNLDFSE